VTAFAVAGLLAAEGMFSRDKPLASPHARHGHDDPDLDARVCQSKKRVMLNPLVLASPDADHQLEYRGCR
jgi:hypothetical protein